jgi:hypothetical protein
MGCLKFRLTAKECGAKKERDAGLLLDKLINKGLFPRVNFFQGDGYDDGASFAGG